MRITRHLCPMDAAANLLQLFGQLFCRDARQQQQELVAAKADQGVGLADAVADDPRHCFQHQITCMVAVGVIVNLEVVQIHHRHTGRTDQAAHRFFVVAPVVYAGEGVAVKLGGIARDAADKVFAVLHVQHRSAMGALDHLQHIGFAVHFVIPGDHLGNVRVKKFQPTLLGAGAQGLLGRTVPGHVFLVAAGIAEIFSAGVGAFPLLYAFHRCFVQQAHVGIDLPQIPDQRLNLLHRFHFSFPSNIRYLPQREPPLLRGALFLSFLLYRMCRQMKRDLAHFCCSFITVLVRFCCTIVAFLVFQLFHPLDERQRVPGQIVPGPPGCHRLQREGAVPERKRVERHRVVQVFQQLAAQEADAVPVGGQRRGCPDVAAFQNFGRMQAAAPQLLQNILALPLGLVLQQQGLPLQPLPGKAALPGGSLVNTDAQVLDTDGSIIPGLYAAGETTGGVHSGNRIGGNAVCDFVVFGRIAGSNASAYAAA